MPEPEASTAKSLGDAVFGLGVALAKLPPGPLAELRRASPGDGVASFWRIYHGQGLAAQAGKDLDWEWVITALALLTSTGANPEKRSAHDADTSLGRALFEAGVSELRVAKVLNSPLPQRREALMRLVRVLANKDARFDTRELAKLLLFPNADRAAPGNPLRRLAKDYYAADAAARKEDSNA
ncbi:type I-E CRISPR-associated protein Cse2/CasB [Pseudochelatococcus sp. B33]